MLRKIENLGDSNEKIDDDRWESKDPYDEHKNLKTISKLNDQEHFKDRA